MPRMCVAGGCSIKASAYVSLHKFPADDVKSMLCESIYPRKTSKLSRAVRALDGQSYFQLPNYDNDNIQPPSYSPHILYTYTHIRLQNKNTNISETNKLHKQNSPAIQCNRRRWRLRVALRYRNIGIVSWGRLLAVSS